MLEDAAERLPANGSLRECVLGPGDRRPDGERRQPVALGGGDDVVQQALGEGEVTGGAGDPSCVREVLGAEVRTVARHVSVLLDAVEG